jgi:hypothetical protein
MFRSFSFRMQHLVALILVLLIPGNLCGICFDSIDCHYLFTADEAHIRSENHAKKMLDTSTMNLFFDEICDYVWDAWTPTARCVTMKLPTDDIVAEPYATMRKNAALYEELVPASIEYNLGYKVKVFEIIKHDIMVQYLVPGPYRKHGERMPALKLCWRDEDYLVMRQ